MKEAFPPISERPLIVELVGPAGAGKTTVLRAIARRDPSVRAGLHIDRSAFLPLLVRQALRLVPAGVEVMRIAPRWWSSGMLDLLRLRALPTVLNRESASAYRAIVLDEGPVFSLVRLSLFQGASRGTGRVAREWHRALEYWARGLAAIFWLDAPNPVLASRIRNRVKDHRVKTGTEHEVHAFLDRYRAAYQDVIERMTANGPIQVVQGDATGESADHAAAGVLSALRQIASSRDPVRVR